MIINILYLPYRFFFVLFTGTITLLQFSVVRLFKGKNAYSLGRLYQQLLERLGGTFIKVGQSLSVRYDLLNEEQCKALSELQDNVKPFKGAKGIQIIGKELAKKGKSIKSEFAIIETEPFASASFSQVYRAEDQEGKVLAVKVKRPGINRMVFADTAFLKGWRLLFVFTGFGSRLGLTDLIDEVVAVLRQELNYKQEAKYIELFGYYTDKLPFFKAPEVYPALCSQKILVMEYLSGISLKSLLATANGHQHPVLELESGTKIRLNSVTNKIYEIMMRSIFELGIFHADPHPGNILVLENGQIGYLDFGIIGTLDYKMQQKNLAYFYYLTQHQTEKAAETFSGILLPTDRSRPEELVRQTRMELEYYLLRINSPDYTRQEKSSAALYTRSMQLARQYGYRLPHNVLLFYKTLFTTDNVLITLDPEFDSKAQTARILKGITRREQEKEWDFDRVMWAGRQMGQFISTLPDTLKNAADLVSGKTGASQYNKNSVGYYLRIIANKIALLLIVIAAGLAVGKFMLKVDSDFLNQLNTGDTLLLIAMLLVGAIVIRK